MEELHRANLRVQVDILRPGTYKALVDHLRDTTNLHGVGHYHVIHFDVHGAILPYDQFQQATTSNQYLFQQRYGRSDIKLYEGMKAFLFLEGEQEYRADPVEASELANLLVNHQVPITILNACQSGKQIGASETSLGSRLMQAGVQTVLAMGYSVTVSAAKLLIGTLYSQFFAKNDLSTAIRSARQKLYNSKGRQAYYGYTIDLEDWLLPVVYQNQLQSLRARDLTPEESVAYYGKEEKRYPQPRTNYGFVGRDLDILYIERYLLLNRNILLVRGMGGAGKTTLLHHLGFWWQTTGSSKKCSILATTDMPGRASKF
ncbi:MAG TPA: CHAT domain-containing protein [Ktedonobacteraceae bacterium]|nr:CHAT domain-containing protein [Ktedonobacteraceae bacterium]